MQTIAPPRPAPTATRGALTVTAVNDRTPAEARAHVRRVLADLVTAERIEACALVASELVTNVARYVGGPMVLDVEIIAERIVIRCMDTGKSGAHLAVPPSVVGADPLEHGYGLFLVAALASSVLEVPVPGGKAVVAFLAVTE